MSKLIKKVFKAVKKVASGVKTFVKKYWKQIAVAALVVFTAGAASVVAAGGTWGGALTSVGSTFSAGASALSGGLVGTSASSAVGAGTYGATAQATAQMASMQGGLAAEGVVAGGGTAAQAASASQAAQAATLASNSGAVGSTIGNSVHGVLSVGGGGGGTASAVTAGKSVGDAMMLGTKIQAAGALYQGYEQKKTEEQAKKDKENEYFYGMNSKGQYAGGFDPNAPTTYTPPAYQSGAASAYTPNPPTLLNRAAYQLPKV